MKIRGMQEVPRVAWWVKMRETEVGLWRAHHADGWGEVGGASGACLGMVEAMGSPES